MTNPERIAMLNGFLEDLRAYSKQYPALVHSWRFGVSAVWAMKRYYDLASIAPPLPQTDAQAYLEDTERNASAFVEGKAPSPDWERGFWYNAAVMRMDALWERLFKFGRPQEKKSNGEKLYACIACQTDVLPTKYQGSALERVRRTVNDLKHEPGGVRTEQLEDSDLPAEAMNLLLRVLQEPVLTGVLQQQGTGRSSRT